MKLFFPFDIHYSLFDILRFYLVNPCPLDPLNPSNLSNLFENELRIFPSTKQEMIHIFIVLS